MDQALVEARARADDVYVGDRPAREQSAVEYQGETLRVAGRAQGQRLGLSLCFCDQPRRCGVVCGIDEDVKEEILLVLLDELIGQAEDRYAALAAAAESPVQKLRAFITARVGMGPGSDVRQVRAWVSIIGEAIGQKAVQKRVGKWLEASHTELSKLFSQAGTPAPEEQASMLLAMILGSFSMHAVQVAGVPGGYAESGMLRWLDGVIRPQSA